MPAAARDESWPADSSDSPALGGAPPPRDVPDCDPRFTTTHWSVVLRAENAGGRSADAHETLARLCRIYWFPSTPKSGVTVTTRTMRRISPRDFSLAC